jgi:hypothetical protein
VFCEAIALSLTQKFEDNGRVYFTATSLFTASFSLTGREPHDTWYFVDMEFLFGVGGPTQDHLSSGESVLMAQLISLDIERWSLIYPRSFPSKASTTFMGTNSTWGKRPALYVCATFTS